MVGSALLKKSGIKVIGNMEREKRTGPDGGRAAYKAGVEGTFLLRG